MQYQPALHFSSGAHPAETRKLPLCPVLGLPLVSADAETVIRTLLAPGRRTVFFLNAHCANIRASNASYAAALARADYVLPDGIGVELAARMQGRRLAANLNGTDLTPRLLRLAARWGMSVFLIGGTPGTADAAAQRLCLDIPGLRIAGTRDGFAGAARPEEAIDEINASGADIVLVAMGVPQQELWIDEHRHLIDAPLVLGVGALFDFLAGNVRRAPGWVRRRRMEWAWRLAMEPRRLAKRYLVGNATFLARAATHAVRQTDAQRVLDIAISGSALAVLGLPMLAVAALVRLDSKGPALFKQVRVGKDGTPFGVYKFRSMHVDAEARRAALLATSDREGVCFKSRNDPRITRIGKYLRRLSIDELPQIINVLKGEMSIVGPRPALPEEVANYPQRAMGRLDVKPGITGLWQVAGRANIGFDKMIDLDLAYVRSRSTLLNLILIMLTFRAVLSGRGAY
ncbi:WecB/TagA/CpsF family glycosyltransferase [Roseovarius indicus]|uniref:WecB/TagA/CpsF family glycosyltransferase n=1 Tax=Roseovarius indicus TaxID=540747 RepID=UPI0007D97536|nr:WecB/TagA/CpsF family glycosyltransferase [Roseovarius indicus]OAO07006.1 UDP-phosphate galactose phosphotransferase [Roseovarius indicus]